MHSLSPEIIYKDDDLVVINKPAGVVVNNADSVKDEVTIQEWAKKEFNLPSTDFTQEPQNVSEFVKRGGVVHRLDRETSGVLILALKESSFNLLQKQFKDRVVEKKYKALVHGETPETGKIDIKIGRVGAFGKFGEREDGRESETSFTRDDSFSLSSDKVDDLLVNNELKLNKNRVRYLKMHAQSYSLLSVFPKTGRTHQIRVHLKYLHFPLVSDLIYGPSKLLKFDLLWCSRLFLHAAKITFLHPVTAEKMSFEADLPDDLQKALKYLKS